MLSFSTVPCIVLSNLHTSKGISASVCGLVNCRAWKCDQRLTDVIIRESMSEWPYGKVLFGLLWGILCLKAVTCWEIADVPIWTGDMASIRTSANELEWPDSDCANKNPKQPKKYMRSRKHLAMDSAECNNCWKAAFYIRVGDNVVAILLLWKRIANSDFCRFGSIICELHITHIEILSEASVV